jgi:SAM-dependent methyltransferase
MPRTSKSKRLDEVDLRLEALESALGELSARLDQLSLAVADRAPFSEIERLNHAFDLISDRAPGTEVQRLNDAYELIAQAFQLISDRAPATEIDRLNYAFDLISDRRQSERIVEVPWVLGKYQGEKRVLEIGYAFAEEHYLQALADLAIPFLVGIDAADSPWSRERFQLHRVQCDILNSCIAPGSFDLILCVSTIEHIGRDNSRYGLDASRGIATPDQEAMRSIAEWLAPGGRLLLTVPFGKYEDVGWLINYDMDLLTELVKSSQLDILEQLYFGWMPGGWREVEPGELKNRGYKAMGAGDASGVALVELQKP